MSSNLVYDQSVALRLTSGESLKIKETLFDYPRCFEKHLKGNKTNLYLLTDAKRSKNRR